MHTLWKLHLYFKKESESSVSLIMEGKPDVCSFKCLVLCSSSLMPICIIWGFSSFFWVSIKQHINSFCLFLRFHTFCIASSRLDLTHNALQLPFLTLAKFLPEPSNSFIQSSLPLSITTQTPGGPASQMILSVLTFLSSEGLTLHVVTCTHEQADSFYQVGVVLSQRGGSPCLWGGRARLLQECADLHASHGRSVIIKSPINSHCWGLWLKVISIQRLGGGVFTLWCMVFLPVCR